MQYSDVYLIGTSLVVSAAVAAILPMYTFGDARRKSNADIL